MHQEGRIALTVRRRGNQQMRCIFQKILRIFQRLFVIKQKRLDAARAHLALFFDIACRAGNLPVAKLLQRVTQIVTRIAVAKTKQLLTGF